tara:strand:+ start:130 stop:900 length:771 start_codon:yes stop_codon:yes gene_type:complete
MKNKIHNKQYKKKYSTIKNNNLLINLWQLFFYNFFSISLIIIFINRAWAPISQKEILIKGNKIVNKEEIIKASSNNFPKPLLSINPKQIEKYLTNKLPLNAVSVRRTIFPLGLEIEIKERDPIAFAFRKVPNGIEKGLIDKEAYWIPLELVNQNKLDSMNLFIEGWVSSKRNSISLILNNRNKLGSPLNKIILGPNREIILETKQFKIVQLGANKEILSLQLKLLAHLHKHLPLEWKNEISTTLDLRNPAKPEIKK